MKEQIKSVEDYAYDVVEDIMNRMGEDYKISWEHVTKNNGVVLTGITIREEGTMLSPIIYVDEFYESWKEGASLDDQVEEILHIYHFHKDNKMDVKEYIEFDRAKSHIIYKLINARANEELLTMCPHIRYFDLAVVFMVVVDHFDNGFICIKDGLANLWGVNADELMELAMVNTPSIMKYNINDIMEILKDMGEIGGFTGPATMDNTMYVLSNDKKVYGAATILYPGVMENIATKLGNSFYILPSSIHEWILVPEGELEPSPEALQDIVKQVNSSTLDDTEILSDSVYYYDKERKEVELLCA